MRASVNWTGRIRIPQKAVKLFITGSSAGALTELRIRGSAQVSDLGPCRVVLEAYSNSQRHRREFAYAHTDEAPFNFSATFPAFADTSTVQCDLKFVSTENAGKIKASARKLKPRVEAEDAPSSSLLPIDTDDSMGELLWRLDTDGDQPVLFVNSRVADWKGFARRPDVQSLILPEVTRGVATWLLKQEDSDEDLGPVAEKWLRFFDTTLGCPLPDEGEEEDAVSAQSAWIHEVGRRFSEKHSFATDWLNRFEDRQ